MSKVKGLQVYDNFLSDQYLNHLKDVFMWSQMIDWKVNLSSRGEREELEKKIFDTQMVCELIKTPYFISPHTKFLCPFLDIMPWTYRAKVNVTFPSEKEPYYLGHHTDQPELDRKHDYYSGVFYMNDSDGYTEVIDPKKLTKKRVDCVENRLAVFPGHWNHTGTTPTNTKARFIINFVFFGEFYPEDIRKTEDNYMKQMLNN